MYSHLLFDAILPNLTPSQIDELRTCNKSLNRKIEKNRLDYPQTMLDSIRIARDHIGYCHTVGNKSNEGSILPDYEKVMKHLESVTTRKLKIVSSEYNSHLDTKWLKKIKNVELSQMDGSEINDLLDRMQCSQLSVQDSKNVNLNKVLELMPHVEEFCFNDEVPSNFMQNLVLKTHLGPGIKKFALYIWQESALPSEDLLHFIKNAKFAGDEESGEAMVMVRFIHGTESAFIKELEDSGFTFCKTDNSLFEECRIELPNKFRINFIYIEFVEEIDE